MINIINKKHNKDNTYYIISKREPKEAENLVSKNSMLSPYVSLLKSKENKQRRKSALKKKERIINQKIDY